MNNEGPKWISVAVMLYVCIWKSAQFERYPGSQPS
jgi:hypothetical protein